MSTAEPKIQSLIFENLCNDTMKIYLKQKSLECLDNLLNIESLVFVFQIGSQLGTRFYKLSADILAMEKRGD